MKKPTILVLPHLFYPEVASTAQIYSELFHELESDFDITVLCSVPCYGGNIDQSYLEHPVYYEKYGNINIVRVRTRKYNKKSKISRIQHIISYYFATRKYIKKIGHFDLVFSCSQPPIIGGVLGRYAKKKSKSKFVYNIQDFNPEQAKAVMSKVFAPAFCILKAIDNKSCKKADCVIVVGNDMKETLNNRLKKSNKECVVINNWIDEKKIYPLPKSDPKVIEFKRKYNIEDKFIFMYSGNIGLYYDLEGLSKVICDAINESPELFSNVCFAFIGEGGVKNNLINLFAEKKINNAVFIPYQDFDDIIYSLNAADVHLVVNAKGIKGVSVPSKCYGVMAVGKPILGVLEHGSECEMLINHSQCGVVLEPGDYEEFKHQLLWFISNKEKITEMGNNGRALIEKHFSKNESINKYRTKLSEIINR